MPAGKAAPPAPTGPMSRPPSVPPRGGGGGKEPVKAGEIAVNLTAAVTMPKEALEKALNDIDFIQLAASRLAILDQQNPDNTRFGRVIWTLYAEDVRKALTIQIALLDYFEGNEDEKAD